MRFTGRTVVALVTVGALGLAACSGGPGGSGGDDGSSPATEGTGPGRDPGRVVALGEEFLLADLLALGIRPVASTATVASAGFQGIEDQDTDGIEPLPSDRADLERLAALRPDTIVTTEFIADQVGRDKLEAMADVVLLPDGLDESARVERLGEVFDRPARARRLVAAVDEAESAARTATPAGCRVSVATVYPGPSLAAWVAEPNAAATALRTMGCELVPGPGIGDPDVSGRIRLSLEEIGRLSAPTLVLLQSHTVEGEDAALADVERNPLWGRLPAVAADDVVVLDRLGYPGAPGRIRLFDDLTAAVAGAE